MRSPSSIDFLTPNNIAIIGASRDQNKVGHVILANAIESGYKGEIFPVNPNARKIKGLKVFKSVQDIDAKVEMAIIVIPAKFVVSALEECGMKGVKNVVIITAGFSEIGDEGFLLEQKIVEVADKFKINVLGPNCLGFINAKIGLNATFSSSYSAKGRIAFASQSGAMGTAFLDWSKENNIGLKYFVSLGNKAALNENYFLKIFGEDPDIDIMLFYLEDFANGREFYDLAQKYAKNKPIVILKPGESVGAQTAMASHTGSIAQDERIVDAALKEAGCIRVKTIEELFNITKLVAWQPLPSGNHIAVITNAGGVGIQTVDDLQRNGLDVIPFSKNLEAELLKDLPGEASAHNPVDLLGDALADRYKDALSKVIKDKSIDSILVVLTPQRVTQFTQTAKYINEVADANSKTVLTTFVGGESLEAAEQLLAKEEIPNYKFPNDAASVLGHLWSWKQRTKNRSKQEIYFPTRINQNLKPKNKEGVVELDQAQELFRKYKLQLLESKIASDKTEAIKIASEIGFPLVLKLTHPDLIHKTEFKAVRLGIENEFDFEKQVRELVEVAEKQGLKEYKFELQPFIKDKIEVIIGISKNPDSIKKIDGQSYIKSKGFGHVMLFGAGGIYTELYKDVSLRLLPVDIDEALDMINETKVGSIIRGLRGQQYDLKGVANIITGLSELIINNTNIKSVDINPLFVTKDSAYIVDLKLFVD